MTKTTNTVAAAKAAARKKTRASAGARLLSRREVLDRIPLSYPTIWSLMRAGKFPRSRGGTSVKALWLESEIDAWINNWPIIPLKGDADTETAESKKNPAVRGAELS